MRAFLLVLLLGSLPALAQDKPEFEVPEKDREKETPVEERRERALANAVQRLGGWPTERARRAAEQLIVQREKSLPLVLEILLSQDRRHESLKPGAAYVLGRIGEKTHFLTLVLIAAEKAQHRHASVFLEAAYRLNPDEAVREAFRFFRLSETTLRREATKFVRDRVTRKHLPQINDLLDRERSERPFTREIGLILLDRLVASDPDVKWEDAGPRFYAALGDESPKVAARAMRILASRNKPDNIASLNELITRKRSYWRQRSYAALSLSILSGAFKVQPLTPETIAVLRSNRGMDHPKEMLAQVSSALALAQAALRTGDKELVRLLDSRIPIILIESVGAGNRHYRDFASVMPLSYAMLRRITGEVFPDQAPLWAQWWRDNGRRFRARRELFEVDDRDIPDTIVEVRRSKAEGGEASRLTVVGETRPSFLHGRAYALPKEEMTALIAMLRETGFFSSPEPDLGKIAREEALVVVRVGDLSRAAAYPKDAANRARILARCEGLAAQYAWQLWWDRTAQPSWALFYGETRKWFFEHKDEQERADRLRRMIAASMKHLLLVDDRLHAMREAAKLPGGGKAFSPADAALLVKAVETETEPNEFVSAVLDLLVPDAGPDVAKRLIDALAAKPDPRALGLLTHLCASLGSSDLTALAEDERWKVRQASVVAISLRAADTARPVLLARLGDKEIQVRAAAAEALARLKEAGVLPTLARMATHESLEIRATAGYSYGLLGGKPSLRAIRPLLYSDPALRVRTRSIDGLVEGTDPGAADLLIGVFERETDATVRAAAARGLVSIESPKLVRDLMARLQLTPASSPERVAIVNVLARFRSEEPTGLLQAVLSGDDMLSADAAALGLARRWDDSSIGQLIRMVEAGRSPRSAIRHLQILSSYASDDEEFQRQAENYKAWYKVNSTGNPRSWFQDALTQRGYDTTSLQELVKRPGVVIPPIPDEAMPLLLRALRDDDWYLRRNAAFLLNQRIGPSAPRPISYNTRPDEEEKSIRFYNDWWAKERERIEAERRG